MKNARKIKIAIETTYSVMRPLDHYIKTAVISITTSHYDSSFNLDTWVKPDLYSGQ